MTNAATLRPAEPGDADRLLAWRNDPATRAASFSDDPVAPADHRAWLSRKLADPAVRLWIAEAGAQPIGTVRAERDAPGGAELHIAMAPEARGRGLATPVLEAAAAAAGSQLGVRRLLARILPGNVASTRAFRRAGFSGEDTRLTRDLCAGPVVAVVQARMGSTRLPGKVLTDAGDGRSLLAVMLERVGRAGTLDAVWIATTREDRDAPIAAEAAALGVPCHRGSEHDVLERYLGAARAAGAGTVVRLTADCPLMVPEAIDRVVGTLGATGADLATNAPPTGRSWPDGMDVEAFTRAALDRAAATADDPADREHVTRWFHTSGAARVVDVGHDPDVGTVRITVDTPEDLAVVRATLARLEPPGLSLESVLAAMPGAPAGPAG